MLKFINLKKLTSHSLIGILFAANFVTSSSTHQAVAQENTSNIGWSVYTDSNFAPQVPTPSTPLPTRTLVNPSFEYPAAKTNYNKMEAYIPGADDTNSNGNQIIEGWYSTHGPSKGASSLVEIWADAVNGNGKKIRDIGVNTTYAAEGHQVAELNAEESSALYQDICVMGGEQVYWSAAHKGRKSATVADVAEVFISDPNDWTGKTFSGNKLYSAEIATTNDASSSSITPTIGSARQETKTIVQTEWAKYSDVWTGPSTSKEYRFAFQSVSTAASDTVGNALDDIQIELSPTVEFVETDATAQVNANNVIGDIYYMTLRVNGNLRSQGTVDITPTANSNFTGNNFKIGTLVAGDGAAVNSGISATNLSDGTIRLTLPEGNYDRNNVVDYITIPLVFSDFTNIKTATYELTTANMSGGGENGILNLITADGSGNCGSDTSHTFSLKSPNYKTTNENDVSLELVLSVDVSSSVSGNHDNPDGEYRKQVDGYIAALQDPDVQNAIASLEYGMAVNMQFWSSEDAVDVGWFKLKKDGDQIDGLDEFIAAIDGVKRKRGKKQINTGDGSGWVTVGSDTDIKLAIDEAVSLLEYNQYTGDRLVIDVSGDGIPDDTPFEEATASLEYGYVDGKCGYTFDCPPVTAARDAAVAKGIIINGLPINNASAAQRTGTDIYGNPFSVSNLADQVDKYYRSQVVGGTDSFSLLADGFDDFERAARLKILKEILPPGVGPSGVGPCNSADGCMPKNTAPNAVDDDYEVQVETSNTLDVTINDTDPDNDAITIVGVEIADNAGELEIVNNEIVYTAPETEGTFSFIYKIDDGEGGVDTAEVTMEVIKYYAD